jgi:hypothetical protein
MTLCLCGGAECGPSPRGARGMGRTCIGLPRRVGLLAAHARRARNRRDRAGSRFGCTAAGWSAPLRKTPQGRNVALSTKSAWQTVTTSMPLHSGKAARAPQCSGDQPGGSFQASLQQLQAPPTSRAWGRLLKASVMGLQCRKPGHSAEQCRVGLIFTGTPCRPLRLISVGYG